MNAVAIAMASLARFNADWKFDDLVRSSWNDGENRARYLRRLQRADQLKFLDRPERNLSQAALQFVLPVPMITKGGLETVTQHLAMEYAKQGIRVNAVAPGVVYTPMHRNTPKDVMEGLSPMGRPSTVKDITDAVLYLTDAATVTGHILYVDGGAHFGRW